jgi:hypothetical protein
MESWTVGQRTSILKSEDKIREDEGERSRTSLLRTEYMILPSA